MSSPELGEPIKGSPLTSQPRRRSATREIASGVSQIGGPRHPWSVGDLSDEAIYEKYADELVRLATGLVGPSDAADVVSMAVVRALGSPSWAGVRDHRGYLYPAVLNEARMNFRTTMRRRARETRSAPRDLVEPPELRAEVLDQVARLSLRQRAVVVLTYWDDLDASEVARRLGISPGAVRRHLARAHRHLREMINDD